MISILHVFYAECYFLEPIKYKNVICLLDLFILQQYFENRLKYLVTLKAEGENPYPHKFEVSMSIYQYIEKYGGLSNGEHLEDVGVSLAGNQNK